MAFPVFSFSKNLFKNLAKAPSTLKKSEPRRVRPCLMQLEDRLVLDTGLAGNNFPLDNTQPYLALNYLVALGGFFLSRDNPYPATADIGSSVFGEVTLFAGNFAPSGYALAQGQILPISQNFALFSVLGTNFGGNGVFSFGLPDLRGQAAVGAGAGVGLTPAFLGESNGSATVPLLINSLPAHDHQLLNPNTNPATVTGTTGSTGASTPINNLVPTLALNYQVVMDSTFQYLGEVALFAGNFAAFMAQGQLLPISENSRLFAKVGTTFGGDGVTTFALPDMQGRVAVGSGSGLGLSTYTLGQKGGTETVTLNTNNLASHAHLQLDTNTPTSSAGGSQPFNNLQPFNTLTYAINTNGFFPARDGFEPGGAEPFIGQIKMFASNSLPSGWLPCDGRVLQINQNVALFSLLGTIYGGDGRTNFGLPDLRGRVPVGAGFSPSQNTTYFLGQVGGTEANTMTVNTMATHAHTTPPIVSITAPSNTAYEGVSSALVNRKMGRSTGANSGNQLIYTITRDNLLGAGSVRLDLDGTASPADYSLAVSSGATFTAVDDDTIEATFPANALSVTLTATALQDRSSESKESLSVTLVAGQDFLLHFSQKSSTGFILDAAPLVTSGGSGAGDIPGTTVNLYSKMNGSVVGTATPFPNFQGEVRVARSDTNGDGIPEIIVSPGSGGGPVIQEMDMETGAVLSSFLAYDSSFTGGVFVALQDMNQDGNPDFITSAGPGGGPHIKVFDGVTRAEIASFFAFDPAFRGGASVAAYDVDGDGSVKIVVGAGPGGGPHVRVFSGIGHTLVKEFYAYDPSFTGGVFVAIGDVGLNGRVDIITGAGAGGGAHVKVWDFQTLSLERSFNAFSEAIFQNGMLVDLIQFNGGVRVGIADFNGDGINDVILGAGPGGGPHVMVFSGDDFELLGSFFTSDPGYRGGVFVS